MENMVVLVVDMQNALIESHPFNGAGVIENIQKLINTARQSKIEVIYVQHDGGIGDELEKNTKGWEIYKAIAPQPKEMIFSKSYNSAFKGTDLQEYLSAKGITSVTLVGMQTEYCIDATCKIAFEYGYRLIIPQATTTTYDNNMFPGELLIKYYEQNIWNGRFAKVVSIDEVIGAISRSTVV